MNVLFPKASVLGNAIPVSKERKHHIPVLKLPRALDIGTLPVDYHLILINIRSTPCGRCAAIGKCCKQAPVDKDTWKCYACYRGRRSGCSWQLCESYTYPIANRY